MTLKVNCDGDKKCTKCAGHQGVRLKAQLAAGQSRRTMYEGKSTLIVPVIMARAGVVMNGSLTVADELIAESWNGVPVTVDHPEEAGSFTSANTPETLSDWSVGRIFNALVDDEGVLRGEAWIDIARANKVMPGLVKMIEGNEDIDVSTGYFCTEESASGVSNGRDYEYIARDIKPDHLALLPNDTGACSWADGCGVRANSRKGRARMKLKAKFNEVLGAVLTSLNLNGDARKAAEKLAAKKVEETFNARGEDDDRRQMIADLISNDDTPYTPDDEDSLRMMSDKTLKHYADQYRAAAEDGDGEETDDEDPEANADGEEEPDGDEPVGNKKGKRKMKTQRKAGEVVVNEATLSKMIANAVSAAVGEVTKAIKPALATAEKLTANRRTELLKKIAANSDIPEAVVKTMELDQLEAVANGLRPQVNYAGLGLPDHNPEDTAAIGMAVNSLDSYYAERAKNKRSAH